MKNESEKLPLAEAAEAMNTTAVNVMIHIKRGLLSGEEVEGEWYVLADSLASFLDDPNRGSNGSICKSHCKHGCGSKSA